MKKTLVLLSVASSLVLPAITHADTPNAKDKKATKTTHQVAVAKPVPAKPHIVYYMCDTARTGSLIPMVYRKYDGRIDSASNAAVYGQTDIANSGQTDVGAALSHLETSITVSHHG